MKRFTEILSGSAAMLFQVALTGWMFAMSEINFDFVSMELNYLLLSALMLLAYYLNILMMRRGIPVPAFAVVQAVFLAAGIFTFVKSVALEPFALRTVIINCIIYCLGFVVAAFLAWMPTNQNGLLLRFDVLAVMSIIMIVLDELLYMPGAGDCLGMCFICLALTLLACISMRSGALAGRGGAVEGNGALGRIMLFAVFGIIGLLALLVIIYASSGVKSFSEFLLNVLTAIVNAVKAALLYVYGIVERIVRWLAQFADDTPMEAVGTESVGNVAIDMGEQAVGPVPGWIYYALGAVALGIVVYIIFKLRKYRTFKIYSNVAIVTGARRESGFLKALKELWGKLKTETVFRWNCLRYRRSAAGLLVWCERKAGEELQRRSDESGEKFLLRLGQSLGGEAETVLTELAGYVERSFYSPLHAEVPPGLCKAVKKTKFKKDDKKGL